MRNFPSSASSSSITQNWQQETSPPRHPTLIHRFTSAFRSVSGKIDPSAIKIANELSAILAAGIEIAIALVQRY
jgi:hypothetical protein